MKICIDISQIVYEGTGVARFTNGLLQSILQYDKKNEWTFFFSSLRKNLDVSLEKKITSHSHKLIKWKLPPTLLSFLWNDLHQFSQLLPTPYNLLPDLFITSDWTEPLLQNIEKATIVHDLTYLRYPETVNGKIRENQEKRLQHVKKESKIIFADSETTKKDLIELLSVDKNRVIVNYPGVNVIKPSKSQIQQTLKKYNLGDKRFILSVGKLEPRKNLERLAKAMTFLKNETLQLIVVGSKGWGETSNIQHLASSIKFLGFVPDSELYSLYSSCLFFVYPSIWEGFGYPIIEAMKLGTPVACSNTSSMKEIAQGAALQFNPLNTDEIYQSIDRLIQDEKLRNELARKGLQRSKLYAWKNYYDRMMAILLK